MSWDALLAGSLPGLLGVKSSFSSKGVTSTLSPNLPPFHLQENEDPLRKEGTVYFIQETIRSHWKRGE